MTLDKKNLFCLSAVLLLTLAAFSSALNNQFLNWDDDRMLTENPSVRSLTPGNIQHIFTSTVQRVYIPLSVFSLAVEYAFAGDHPFIYHLDNVLLHLLVTGLIFVFALRMGLSGRAAGWAALLFGIHPMHVESVAWVTERKDVLYSVFYMASLISYWQYLEGKKKTDYGLSIVFGFLSILAKPMAISLPLVLFLLDWFKNRGWNKKILVLILRLCF